jgi:hypothetical protein
MEWWTNLHALTRAALVCFILGKFHFIPTVLTLFMAYKYSLFFIIVYSVFIAAAVVLSLIRMKQIMQESKTDV